MEQSGIVELEVRMVDGFVHKFVGHYSGQPTIKLTLIQRIKRAWKTFKEKEV